MASVESRNGKYMVRWRVHGKQRTKMHDSWEAANSHRIEIESDLITGKAIDPHASKVTFGEWAASWQANRQGYRDSTKARNKALMVKHVLPVFRDARLDSISQQDIQRFVTTLTTTKGTLTGKDLSASTVKIVYNELNRCLTAAVHAKALRHNPCVGIELPKIEQQEMHFATKDQVIELADKILPRYKALILVLGFCGLRIGEACALLRSDVDLEKNVIKVTKTVVEVDSKMVTNPPKTRAGRRIVPMPQYVADALKSHMDDYSGDFLFTGRQGGQIRANAFRQRAFKNGKAKTSLPKDFRIHDLRHSAISFWIANGVDILRVKKWAGHEKSTTILDIYGHLYEDDDSMFMKVLDEALA